MLQGLLEQGSREIAGSLLKGKKGEEGKGCFKSASGLKNRQRAARAS